MCRKVFRWTQTDAIINNLPLEPSTKYSFQLKMGTISKLFDICGYENSRLSVETEPNLLGRSIFGHGFGAFRDGVLRQLSREKETNSGLDLSG